MYRKNLEIHAQKRRRLRTYTTWSYVLHIYFLRFYISESKVVDILELQE